MGLRNGGATCYMNSVFQQLYMQPTIRALVLGGPEPPPPLRPDSVFFQMQVRGSLGVPPVSGHVSGVQVSCMRPARLPL